MSLRTVIADDEPLALVRLRQELAQIGDIEVVGIAANGAEALELIGRHSPDLVLLDVAMPELSGISVVEALREDNPPAVVLISAHDQFAIDGFREGAVDYLLKPLDGERLRTAIDRARAALSSRDAADRIRQLGRVIDALKAQQALRERSQDDDLWVPHRGLMVRVPLATVDWFGVDGDYVIIHASGQEYLIHDSLRNLEAKLDASQFARVHRNAIVRMERVTAIERTRFGIRLRLDSGETVAVGRTYRNVLDRIAPAGAQLGG